MRPWEEVQVINLSPAGAMIEHVARLAPREVGTLTLRLNGLDFRLWTRVVWSHLHRAGGHAPDGAPLVFRSGLHFAALSWESQLDLRQFLKTQCPATRALP